ncbi:MAG: beta-lactamase family protein [Candidatus Delongbacteria bacterium]|nr:beta-lactamase family protein [Candidatus Delongbacteria bacterium]MBN2835961.1 beta-lactamase family protein [Candidatus Delongbacteria bacterium]
MNTIKLILSLLVMLLVSSCKNSINGDKDLFVIEPEIFYHQETTNLDINEVLNPSSIVLNDSISDLLNEITDNFLSTTNSEGIGISVNFKDSYPWNSYRGFSDSEKSISVDSSTQFHTASCGKLIMSTLIFSLIENEQLSLDDQIIKWFPNEKLFKDVTIDHLLSHTSGIVTYEILKKFNNGIRIWSEEELVELVVSEQNKKLFTPGSAFHYSNTGYVLLGIIARKVTGKSVSEIFEQNIKSKVGLIDIYYLDDDNCNSFITASFDLYGDYIIPVSSNYVTAPHGAGAFSSTPTELTNFFNKLLSGEILNSESLIKLLSNLRLCERNDSVEVFYGRGIRLIKILVPGKEASYIGHAGQFTGFGFKTNLFHCIENHVSISIMTNNEITTDPLMFKLAEAFK